MRALLAVSILASLGCGASTSPSAGGLPEGGTGGAADGAGAVDSCATEDVVDERPAPCADPLRTGVDQQDSYDCQILEAVVSAGEPDPMIFKAEIAVSSAFDVFATSLDSPCGVKAGWTDAESKSFGLMQLTPACGQLEGGLGPDGRPNLTTDECSSAWSASVYNPSLNIREGVRSIHVVRQDTMRAFPGCSEDDYTLMAVGAFHQGMSTITGCRMLNVRGQTYVDLLLARYRALAAQAGWPVRY